MSKSSIWVVLFMTGGIAVLCGLGSWQLERLAWKEMLVEQVAERTQRAPVSLADVLAKLNSDADVEYIPVTVSGTFDHTKEVYYLTTSDGASGWNVLTPLVLADGNRLIVNRGFVPNPLRDPTTRSAGQVSEPQVLTGLVRTIHLERPNSFVPDNNLDRREFFWKSHSEMVELMNDGINAPVIPIFVDVDETPNPGGWPKGGATIISFPNNHLQYAFTWFGLALALLGVGSYFLYARHGRE